MKILVTGGSGFVGSHLCESLLNDGHFVYCVDNLSTGFKSNIKHLENNTNFEFIHHDVIEPLNLLVDQIYSLASPASPPQYQKNPVYTTKTNVLGSINMLELALKNKARILLSSTSEIYGDPEVHPQSEKYNGNVNPCSIRSCYDESKRCAETLFFDYHRNYGVDIRVIRIFNCYGPKLNQSDGRVISNFIKQALKNEPITIYGQGRQTRSFQFIDDLIVGMKLMMNNEKSFTGPVNLGNPNEFTIYDLAQSIIKLTNSNSKIVYMDLPQDDPKQRKPDISLAKKKLNWEPKINLEEGLAKTIEYFKKEIQ